MKTLTGGGSESGNTGGARETRHGSASPDDDDVIDVDYKERQG